MSSILPSAVYSLCFVTSAACAWLLVRSYARTGLSLLLWSAICFLFLAANNLILVIDLLVVPELDLSLFRHAFSLAGVSILLFGFIWNLEG